MTPLYDGPEPSQLTGAPHQMALFDLPPAPPAAPVIAVEWQRGPVVPTPEPPAIEAETVGGPALTDMQVRLLIGAAVVIVAIVAPML